MAQEDFGCRKNIRNFFIFKRIYNYIKSVSEVTTRRANRIVESLPLRILSDEIKSKLNMIVDIMCCMAILNS